MIGTRKKNNLLFGFGIFIILFHLLRNVSSVYFLIVGIALFLFFAVSLCYQNKNIFKNSLFFSIIIFIYVCLLSIISTQEYLPFLGLFRLFYLTPVIIYFFSANIDNNQSFLFWKIILFFLILSSFSLLLQYIIGPIYWFANSSERAGADRFASLVGSLTAFGGVVGVGIIISSLLYKKGFLFIASTFFLLFGAVLSLQKMAIASIVLSYCIIYYINFRNSNNVSVVKLVIGFFLFILFISLLYNLISNYFPQHIEYFSLIFTSDASSTGDVSVSQSMSDRFFELPMSVVEHWGILPIVLGLGVYGGAGGLGYSELPMAHNLIFETIFIFGLPLGIFIILLNINIFLKAMKIISRPANLRYVIASAVFIVLLLTSIFSGSLFYHPVMGLIFWFSISEIYRSRRNVSLSK